MKAALGIAIALATGFVCRALGIPAPAPPALIGALLVTAMTVGYVLTDRCMTTRAAQSHNCAGPSGRGAPTEDPP
jgi:XapX domain-containing protein